ncbi:uncharacterized protein LOC122076133 [Macadamia integrifolia]|uniref:uncharacterized protein LOC122076133 n=1 Tax=Macadamia integrifolia TaxID=60698 RepID=UPI001C4E7870|nr:uncharacterized protein LOC122076133 [Macadamia integrifolia]XP_042497369.1 uncharacterized protein LOC122076133 [Macadamia integrifolia]XP_042497370.1 uncharacterized protein LOC122076133 [Macadamia integrifolia]XP_042497371.1 uncharacterized protein LOC122076133 [Macadamia integrifolia]
MELRSFSHLHFIGAIKNGMVEKIINVDSHGRPALRLKTIEAIYESEDAKNLGSCTTFQQQGRGLMSSPFGCGGVKIDRPVLLTGGRKIKTDPELCHLGKDACDDIRKGDMDDLCYSEITLKQLKDRCKTKKRKLPKSVELKKEPGCHLSEYYAKLEPKEDESDLDESLSSWKLKLKKVTAKRKCIKKEVHSPSKSAVSVSASEQTPSSPQSIGDLTGSIKSEIEISEVHSPSISAVSVLVSEQTPSAPQNSPQSTLDLTGSIKSEIEISGPEFSECHNLDGFTFGATVNSHSVVDISANRSDEVAGICERSELAIGQSIFLTTESRSCVVTEVSIECLDQDNSLSSPASSTAGDVMEDSFAGVISQETLSEVINQEKISSPDSELDTNVSITQSNPNVSPMEALSVTNKPGSETCGSYESYSFMQGTSCEMDSSSVMHMPHKLNLDVGFRCTKPDCDGGYILSMETGDGSEEDTLPDPKTNATRNSDVLYMPFQKSHEDFNSPSDFSSIVCSSPTIEVKQKSSLSVEGLMSTGVDTGNDGDTKDDNLPDPETSVMNNRHPLHLISELSYMLESL